MPTNVVHYVDQGQPFIAPGIRRPRPLSVWGLTLLLYSLDDCHTLPNPDTNNLHIKSHLTMQVLPHRLYPHTSLTPLPLYYQRSTASPSWSTLLITSYTKALSPLHWVFTMFSSVEDCHNLPHPQTITTYMTSHLPMQMLLYRMHPHTPQTHFPLSTNVGHYVPHGQHFDKPGIL